MNLANKITVARMLLIPLFLVLLLHVPAPAGPLWALVLYILASSTDKLDGWVARKYNLVTTFGKFLDPLADKLLVLSALICLTWYGRCSPYISILVLMRELVVTSFRIVAMGNGLELAADGWGKAKTFVQNVAVYLTLLGMAAGRAAGRRAAVGLGGPDPLLGIPVSLKQLAVHRTQLVTIYGKRGTFHETV